MNEVSLLLLGFGNVGQAVARLLEENEGYRRESVLLRLHAVFDRGGGVLAAGRPASELIATKRDENTVSALEGARRVVFEEAMSEAEGESILVDTSVTEADTGGPGLAPAKAALSRGISVVFASKGPLVSSFAELRKLARDYGARLGASASVGIPLPSIEVGALGLRGSELRRFRGILNDTTNQILRDLESGISLEDAIERARLAGTLEEDPRLDLEGWDAAYKLLILARVIWDPSLAFDPSCTRGVDSIGRKELDEARSRRRRIRLVATAEREPSGKIRLRIEPEALDSDDPLYALGPGEKSLVFDTETMGKIALRSSSSGPLATAACVLKDVLNIAAPPGPFCP